MDDRDRIEPIEPSVFGEEDDDPFAVPPPLAPLAAPGEDKDAADNVVQTGDNEAGQDGREKDKRKKRSSRPRVNLNENRLCSEKGIAALKNLCADVHFKGKGHEASDLNKLLQKFEHWAQCLMPSWPFENVVQQCEKLGAKRKVKNELRRMRYDEDGVVRGDSENEHEADEVDAGQAAPTEEQPQPETEPAREEPPVDLTEEQLERIRRNKELAFARREALKRRKLEQASQESIPGSSREEQETESQNVSEQHTNSENPSVACAANRDGEDDSDTAMETQGLDKNLTEERYEFFPKGDTMRTVEEMSTDTENKDASKQLTTFSETHDPFNECNRSLGAEKPVAITTVDRISIENPSMLNGERQYQDADHSDNINEAEPTEIISPAVHKRPHVETGLVSTEDNVNETIDDTTDMETAVENAQGTEITKLNPPQKIRKMEIKAMVHNYTDN